MYDRIKNAVLIGYCANILAGLMGLVLMATGHIHAGASVCSLVGVSFGMAYVAEQSSEKIRGMLQPICAACTFSAYLFTLTAV